MLNITAEAVTQAVANNETLTDALRSSNIKRFAAINLSESNELIPIYVVVYLFLLFNLAISASVLVAIGEEHKSVKHFRLMSKLNFLLETANFITTAVVFATRGFTFHSSYDNVVATYLLCFFIFEFVFMVYQALFILLGAPERIQGLRQLFAMILKLIITVGVIAVGLKYLGIRPISSPNYFLILPVAAYMIISQVLHVLLLKWYLKDETVDTVDTVDTVEEAFEIESSVSLK